MERIEDRMNKLMNIGKIVYVLILIFAIAAVCSAAFINTGKAWNNISVTSTPATTDLGSDHVYGFSIINSGTSDVYACIGDTNDLNTLMAATNAIKIYANTNTYTFPNRFNIKLSKVSYQCLSGEASTIDIAGY